MTFYIPIRLGRNATQDAVNSLTIKLVRAYINIAFQVSRSKSWDCGMSNVFTKMFKADTFISLNKFRLQFQMMTTEQEDEWLESQSVERTPRIESGCWGTWLGDHRPNQDREDCDSDLQLVAVNLLTTRHPPLFWIWNTKSQNEKCQKMRSVFSDFLVFKRIRNGYEVNDLQLLPCTNKKG